MKSEVADAAYDESKLIVVTDPMDKGPLRYFFYIDTKKASYRSTDLARLMRLWRDYSMHNDPSPVQGVGRLG